MSGQININNDENNNIMDYNINNNINNRNIMNNNNNWLKNDNNIRFCNEYHNPNNRNVRYYFPIEDVDKYMRERIIPRDYTFMNKDLCSIYLCDYLPLTNNSVLTNDLTINDTTSRYNENYKKEIINRCLDIKNKFFSKDYNDNYIYPTGSFKYKETYQSNIKITKSLTRGGSNKGNAIKNKKNKYNQHTQKESKQVNRINRTGQELSSNNKVLRTKTYYQENLQEITPKPSLRQLQKDRSSSVNKINQVLRTKIIRGKDNTRTIKTHKIDTKIDYSKNPTNDKVMGKEQELSSTEINKTPSTNMRHEGNINRKKNQ